MSVSLLYLAMMYYHSTKNKYSELIWRYYLTRSSGVENESQQMPSLRFIPHLESKITIDQQKYNFSPVTRVYCCRSIDSVKEIPTYSAQMFYVREKQYLFPRKPRLNVMQCKHVIKTSILPPEASYSESIRFNFLVLKEFFMLLLLEFTKVFKRHSNDLK